MALLAKVKKLNPEAKLPTYAVDGSACFDFYSLTSGKIWEDHPLICNTGLAFEIPSGHVLLIFSRSGHGFKNNIRLSNCTGIIDHGFSGEIKIKLTKDSSGGYYQVEAGDRIAQGMIIPFDRVEFELVDELSESSRGTGGFGHTGR